MKTTLGSVAIAVCLLWGASASASTISITLSETGFAPLNISSNNFFGAYGTYSSVSVTALGITLPDVLDSTVLTQQGPRGSGTLNIVVSEAGITPAVPFLDSSFTNLMNGSSILKTELNFGALDGATFTIVGSQDNGPKPVSTGSPYSVQELFTFAAAPGKKNSAAIDIEATPIPAALPLFAGGLGLVGGFASWRKRKSRSAAAAV